jgi:ferritin-like metal-binding protein YciE
MTISNVQDLFRNGLEHAYDCEQRLAKALPKMAQAANSAELRVAFETHLDETIQHAQRLERIFTMMGRDPEAKTDNVVRELVNETEEMMSNIDSPPLLDVALIVCGNKVEHLEMAVYGSLRTFAELLGKQEATSLLQQTLLEEKAADAKLTTIGESKVNARALSTTIHA